MKRYVVGLIRSALSEALLMSTTTYILLKKNGLTVKVLVERNALSSNMVNMTIKQS